MTDRTTKLSEINFIVGSVGVDNKGSKAFDLRHELNLVKAALLYADHVKLISIGALPLKGSTLVIEALRAGTMRGGPVSCP